MQIPNKVVICEMSEYQAAFYKLAQGGTPVPIGTIGNAGVGSDFCEILRQLGHDVRIRERETSLETREAISSVISPKAPIVYVRQNDMCTCGHIRLVHLSNCQVSTCLCKGFQMKVEL